MRGDRARETLRQPMAGAWPLLVASAAYQIDAAINHLFLLAAASLHRGVVTSRRLEAHLPQKRASARLQRHGDSRPLAWRMWKLNLFIIRGICGAFQLAAVGKFHGRVPLPGLCYSAHKLSKKTITRRLTMTKSSINDASRRRF